MTTLTKDEVLKLAQQVWSDEFIGWTDLSEFERFAHLCRADLEAENENLRTVMMAAAVEISEHWDAHCDDEGYGPFNLLRRLENGYPEQYGYGAATVAA